MGDATEEEQIKILLEMKDVQAKLKSIDSMFTTSINNATNLGKVIDAISTKLDNLANVSSSVQNQVNNFDFSKAKKAVKGVSGSVMTSDTGRGKIFKDYQQAVIEETKAHTEHTKELAEDTKERKRLRQQNADAATINANANATRARKQEDQNSIDYINRQNKLAEAKLLNAKANQTGRLLISPRHQFGTMYENVGQKIGTIGVGSDKIEGRLIGDTISAFGTLLKSPIAGGAAALTSFANAVVDIGKSATQAYAEIESIKTQLGVVFSNQSQADSMFGEISQYAVKSPFGVQQTSELAVLLKQSGVYASDLMDTLKMIGDTAGGNMEKMKRIANNYAQIVSIGKASMLDMRQFAYAGIPIFEAVSKELGVSQQELRKLISDGKVTSDIIEKVFKDLTGINGIFENATEKGAKTLKARLQNLADAKQLAMGEVGNWAVGIGTQTGNDSLAHGLIESIENVYEHLKKSVNTHNIERDVKSIAERNNRIEVLKKLIEQTDNKEAKETYKRELAKEEAKINVDSDRNTLALSYDVKRKRLDEAIKALDGYSINDAKTRYRTLDQYSSIIPFYSAIPALDGEKSHLNDYATLNESEIDDLKDLFKELVKSLKLYSNLTEEEIKANKERNLLSAQQLAYDRTNSAANASGSLMSSFKELTSIYRGTDKYKKQEEQKRQETLKNALEELKKIAKNTDEKGNVDITKYNAEQLSSYFKQGAFEATEKLAVVEDDKRSAAQKSEDRALLNKQYSHVLSLVKGYVDTTMGGDTTKALSSKLDETLLKSLESLNDEDFFKQFYDIYTQQKDAIDSLEKLAPRDSKGVFETLKELLDKSLNRIATDTGGTNVTEDDIKDSKDAEFVPLWKRILAQYTGLTTTGMLSTQDTMEKYRDNMAARNITAGVLSSTIKSIGFDAATELAVAGSKTRLKKDSADTLQVKWDDTIQNVKEFSLRLSTATDVIDSYKKGLEDQIDVYSQLYVASKTQGETQGANQQQFLTTAQLKKMGLSNAQLVNAFGDKLVTKSGKEYSVDEIHFDENGNAFDKNNNLIEEQIKITDNLTKFIEAEMPKITAQLREANTTALNNRTLKKMYEATVSTQMTASLLQSRGAADKTVQFLMKNPDYLAESINAAMTEERNGKNKAKYNWLAKKSNTDVITLYNQVKHGRLGEVEEALKGTKKGTEEYKDLNNEKNRLKAAKELYETAEKNAQETTDEFVNSPVYVQLRDYLAANTRDADVNNKVYQLDYFYKNGRFPVDELTPENYSGWRGSKARLLKNAFGLDQKSDIEDLYKAEGAEGFWDKRKISWKQGLVDSLSVMKDFSAEMENVLANAGKDAFVQPFEKIAENLTLGKDALEGMGDAYKNLGAELLSASGQAMQKAGWELVARGAADKNYAMIAAGLGLAATGGVASGIGAGLSDKNKDKDDDKEKLEKLNKLKDNLADLLKQAREDAIYYENTLRHKKAISANQSFTSTKVNDAIITPKGDVISTHPDDYLIATKTPRTLIGGGGTPNVTFNLIDKSTGVRITNQKTHYDERTNTLAIEGLIESKFNEMIATSKGDEAFAARAARINGKSVIA